MDLAFECVALDLVSGIASQATTIIAQTLPAMLNPAMAGVSMMSQAQNNTANYPSNQPMTTIRPDPFPSDATDPAYKASATALPLINSLVALLGDGSGTGVQWESFPPAKDGKSGLQFIRVTLNHTLTHEAWTEQQPSVELKAALESCIKVKVLGYTYISNYVLIMSM
jgi:hypothetical protein